MVVKLKTGPPVGTLSLMPLLDVIFLLLIFFLVATRFAEEDREMELPLPDASEAMPLTVAPREVFINIDAEGRYFVQGKEVEAAELEQILLQAAANNPHQAAIIRADRNVSFQVVVTAGNLCKRAGVEFMANISPDE
jgi:biopolymer transport protein ExbD